MRAWYCFWQFSAQVVFSTFFDIRAYGRENVPQTGPVLLACNHQSFIDPILCGFGIYRECDFVARESLFRNPTFGRYISSLNAFPIHRDQADLAGIRSIIKRLQNGSAIVLFPEATRTTDGRIRPIKSGFELIARRSQATTVPVVIDGAFETWPRHQRLPRPGKISIMYGSAITAEQTKKLKRQGLVREVDRQLRQMQHELRLKNGRKPFDYSDNPIES
ncbi:MAG: 1-acyl-sn-glycerol-3-phosphate acyltransferase [Sedimentisphaerales bacterium]|nr:1-acyl-sn-glycerol-3-phosphate acyltransferase [Sedimentisphaerales bacterium]